MYSIYTVLKKSLRLATLPPCRERVCSTWCELGSGGVETPDTPVGLDVRGGGDVVEGLGVDGLASSASGWRVVYRGCGTKNQFPKRSGSWQTMPLSIIYRYLGQKNELFMPSPMINRGA